jgi:hypothetical protein
MWHRKIPKLLQWAGFQEADGLVMFECFNNNLAHRHGPKSGNYQTFAHSNPENDKNLGGALVSVLRRARFVTPADDIGLKSYVNLDPRDPIQDRGDQYIGWLSEIMAKYKFLSINQARDYMKYGYARMMLGGIFIEYHRRPTAGKQAEPAIALSEQASEQEVGAALRLALSRCG